MIVPAVRSESWPSVRRSERSERGGHDTRRRDVRGKLSDAAIAALQALGLTGVVATRVVNTALANTVIAQDVAPGTIVNLGATLKLTVSTGLIVIPNPVIPTPIG